MLKKFKIILSVIMVLGLFACTTPKAPKPHQSTSVKKGYLKEDISQSELNNRSDYKAYYYTCRNAETGSMSYLTTYFPLSRESRMKDNFGFYFQLDGSKAVPFDHIENRTLNTRGSRFEVLYRSYNPIQGSFVDLVARQSSSIYYKTYQGLRTVWLNCKGG